jgi:multidrug resistance efflux pump
VSEHSPKAGPLPGQDGAANGATTLRDRVKSLRLTERAPVKRTPLTLLPWALVVLFFLTTVAMAMRKAPRQPESEAKDDDGSTHAGAPAVPAGGAMLDSKGYIIPIHQIQVSPKVGGMVVSLRFEEGMILKKDAILAVLEKVDYQADHDRCRGLADAAWGRWWELINGSRPEEIEEALADYNEAVGVYEQELAKYKSAQAISGPAMSREDRETYKAKVDSALARMNRMREAHRLAVLGPRWEKIVAAWADVVQLEADFAKAKWRLDNCVIRAPVTGMILTRRAEKGSLVNPSAFSNGLSASLCDMADLAELEVDMSIPERDVARLIDFKINHKKPQKCIVRADAFAKKTFQGYVSRIMPTADRAKGAVPVRVRVLIDDVDVGIYLRPDMGASVTFLNEELDVVPPASVDPDDPDDPPLPPPTVTAKGKK